MSLFDNLFPKSSSSGLGLNPRYGSPGLGSYLRERNDANFNSEKETASAQAALKRRIARELSKIAEERRARYLEQYAPLATRLAQDATTGQNPDLDAIRTEAQNDVGNAFNQQSAIIERNSGRYGIRPTVADKRRLDLENTAGQVFAGNTAVNTAKDRSEDLNQARGVQALSLGMNLPTQAAAGISRSGGILGDAYGTQLSNTIMEGQDNRNLSEAISYGAGAGSRLFADGGIVGLGGGGGQTIHLRKKYGEYATTEMENGRSPKEWPDWLKDNGYVLTDRGTATHAPVQQPVAPPSPPPQSDRPQTPGFLLRPHTPMTDRPPGYAEGGRVGGIGKPAGRIIDGHSERVDLNTNDFIIPADVVKYYGEDFFNQMIQEYGA